MTAKRGIAYRPKGIKLRLPIACQPFRRRERRAAISQVAPTRDADSMFEAMFKVLLIFNNLDFDDVLGWTLWASAEGLALFALPWHQVWVE